MRIFVLLFVISALITAGVRTLLGRHGLMDLPNARSSHAVPVPRGGGVGIVVAFLSAVVWVLEKRLIPDRLAWALIGGGLAIAIVWHSRRPLQVGCVAAYCCTFPRRRMGCLVSRCNAPRAVRWWRRSLDVGSKVRRIRCIGLAHKPFQLHGRHRRIGCYGGSLCKWDRCISFAPR